MPDRHLHINEDVGRFSQQKRTNPNERRQRVQTQYYRGVKTIKHTSALMRKRTEREHGSIRKQPKIPPSTVKT